MTFNIKSSISYRDSLLKLISTAEDFEFDTFTMFSGRYKLMVNTITIRKNGTMRSLNKHYTKVGILSLYLFAVRTGMAGVAAATSIFEIFVNSCHSNIFDPFGRFTISCHTNISELLLVTLFITKKSIGPFQDFQKRLYTPSISKGVGKIPLVKV